MSRTRSEHIAWCQMRALGYVDRNDPKNAVASMMSDLHKHPDTEDHVGILLGLQFMAVADNSSNDQIRHWIEGFN